MYFRNNNPDGRYKEFVAIPDAEDTFEALCNTADVLDYNVNNVGLFYAGGRIGGPQIIASLYWARDQTDCDPRTKVPLRIDSLCVDTFRVILSDCDGPGGNTAYGGGFVDDNEDPEYRSGCVVWSIFAEDRTRTTNFGPEEVQGATSVEFE